MRKTLVENSRVEPTIFFMEKIQFLWNFYLAILWVIKTVRFPLKACMHFVCNCVKSKESELNHFQNLKNGGKGTFQDIFSPIMVYDHIKSALRWRQFSAYLS